MESSKKCYIKGDWSRSGYFNHNWAYKNTKERVCLECGEEQIYFGNLEYGEDWRLKYTKRKK